MPTSPHGAPERGIATRPPRSAGRCSPWQPLGVAILLLATAATCAGGDGATPDPLLGNWACDFGACPDEEIAFALIDGVPVYSSWLHARPSAVDGRWSHTGNVLTVNCCDGLEQRWLVLKLDDETLVLRAEGTEEDAVLRRIGDDRAAR